MKNEAVTSSTISAEITVSTSGGGGSTPMTPAEFLEYLKANGFVGNAAYNDNYPGVAWIEFRNGI